MVASDCFFIPSHQLQILLVQVKEENVILAFFW